VVLQLGLKMWKSLCLLLLGSWSHLAFTGEKPFVIYPQGVRQPRDLGQDGVTDNKDALNDVTEILFGLDEPNGEEEERKEKSLLNTFPFNQAKDQASIDTHESHHENGHHSHGHHEAQEAHDFIEDRGVARSPLRQQLSNRNSELGQSHSVASFPFGVAGRESQLRQEDRDNSSDESEVSINAVVTKGIKEDGRKCLDKVMMVEETVYDEVITCDHSYDKRCHTSYITNYESQQEEECEENFKKVCMINYEDLAYNSTVEICRTPLVKDCDIPGEEVCQTIYESECATVQIVHEVEDDVTNCRTEQMKKCKEVTEGYTTRQDCDEWPVQRCSIEKKKVKKYTPETKCYKEPREHCAPRGCGFRNGSVECHDKVKTIVVDNPVETCEMEPVRTCKHVSKLVPKLVPVEECADVPKEICARSKTNPRKVKKPVIKKWCYVPSKESGLL